jgi:predicted anti-sigma-YlaC factor YlaD
MKCSHVRLALSARLDGENYDAAGLADHMSTCTGCRDWLAAARRLDAAFAAAPTAPDLTVAVLTRLAIDRSGVAARSRLRSIRWRYALRLAIGLVAAVQLLLAMPGVLGLAGAHASHEAASFDAALAIAFLLAAYRPGLARAYTPVALVLAGCLAITGALDVAGGRASLAHEVAHLVAVAQAGLMWALARHSGDIDEVTADRLPDRVAAR